MAVHTRNRDLVERFVAAAEAAGWRVEDRRGHGRVCFWPTDRSQTPVFYAHSSSDWRSIRNLRAHLRARGLDV